jgi:hypothetical protein
MLGAVRREFSEHDALMKEEIKKKRENVASF